MVENTAPVTARAFERLSDIVLNGIDVHRCAAATALSRQGHRGASAVLQKALLDEDEDVRVDAVSALAVLRDKKSAAAIMENFLGDPCPDVKLAAIKLLAELDHREIIPYLLKLITARDDEIAWDDSGYYESGWDDWLDIQRAAISALGKMRVSQAVPQILKALHDVEGQDVASVAIPALVQLGQEGAQALSNLYDKGDAKTRRRICAVLEPGQSAQFDKLFSSCLTDKAAEVRRVALDRLIESNPADERLTNYFNDPDAAIRETIMRHLGAAIPSQVYLRLSDKSPRVRQAAFRVIANVPHLFERSGFSDVVRKAIAGVPEVAGDAAVAWAALIGPPCARSLGEALQNKDQPLAFRLGLIEALGSLKEDGLTHLSSAAGDSNRQVRVSALSAISDLATQSPWPNNASETLLAALDGKLVAAPIDNTAVEDSNTAQPDAEDLNGEVSQTPEGRDDHSEVEDQGDITKQSATVDQVATSTLDQLLNDNSNAPAQENEDREDEPQEVELSERDEHFLEISRLRAMKKSKIPLDLKLAPHLDVRQFAARLLGDFDRPGLAQALCHAMDGDSDGAHGIDRELEYSCLESLALIGAARGKLSTDLAGSILSKCGHKDRDIRRLAARCLGYLPAEVVDEQLIKLGADKDVHVRLEAIVALGRKGAHDKALLAALRDEYSGVRIAAAKALGGSGSSLDALIALSLRHDGMHQKDVVAICKNANANEAAGKFLDILDNEEFKRVWLVAIEALGSLLSADVDEEVQVAA